jgi:hypothetical protein
VLCSRYTTGPRRERTLPACWCHGCLSHPYLWIPKLELIIYAVLPTTHEMKVCQHRKIAAPYHLRRGIQAGAEGHIVSDLFSELDSTACVGRTLLSDRCRQFRLAELNKIKTASNEAVPDFRAVLLLKQAALWCVHGDACCGDYTDDVGDPGIRRIICIRNKRTGIVVSVWTQDDIFDDLDWASRVPDAARRISGIVG